MLVVLACYGLQRLRNAADGFRNVLSVRYWLDRGAGIDLYNPTTHYLKRGRHDRHEVLLTFDDGPHEGSCESILSTLESQGVPAAFFVVGRRVKQNPALVQRMIRDGFEVGNHTEDHLRLDKLSASQVQQQIVGCEQAVEHACGHKMTLLRPPGMRLSPEVNAETSVLGYTIVGWNIGAKDFIPDQQVTDMSAEESSHLRTTPSQVEERVMKQVKDGTIILLHDNPVTAEAVPAIIRDLKAQGYRFRTVTQLLAEMPHPVAVVANPPCDKFAMAVGRSIDR